MADLNLDACRRLIALESTPNVGNAAAAEFVADLCRQAGFAVESSRDLHEGLEQINVIARPPGQNRPEREIMLQTHLDTVSPGAFTQWTKTASNPFDASIYDDEIFGLGTADAKLDFLCKLEAAKQTAKPIVLVATFGAHNGMAGAIKLMRRRQVNATHALIGAPTEGRLVIAGSGQATVEISIPFSDDERAYRLRHDDVESSTTQSKMFAGSTTADPQLGHNAIIKMLEYLSHLPVGIAVMDLHGGTDSNSTPSHAVLEIDAVAGFRDPILPKISRIYTGLAELDQTISPGHAAINLGMIRANENEVWLNGSCRLPPGIREAAVQGWLNQIGEVVKGTGATFRVKDFRGGFSTSAQSPLVRSAQQVLRNLGHDANLEQLPVTTEANVFSRLGVECLVWGPGLGLGNAHAPNERIQIRDLKMAIQFYRQLIERFCV